ncbi:MAG: CpsD/CapB family tyrosine-protein kinase, partial [Gammaproteobacteria bacterium]|nr:CpsD/CapB family tyrosine-protein kinase [Gammaproteobacteria bacterium]
MGKLETALRRAKELHAGKRGSRRESPIAETDADQPGSAGIWQNLARVELDTDTMARHRLTEGSKQYFGAAMAYNMLRTRLIKRMRDNAWSSVIVTSPNPGAGKTVTALNLAFSLAREQSQRTYLIDLDFRVPSLHTYVGVTPTRDITSYLDGECSASEVVSASAIDRLYFGFNTVQHEYSAELLTSRRMREFVGALKDNDPNAAIIYDAPPVLAADDVLAFGPLADAVLLVVAEGETSRDDLAKAVDLLSD